MGKINCHNNGNNNNGLAYTFSNSAATTAVGYVRESPLKFLWQCCTLTTLVCTTLWQTMYWRAPFSSFPQSLLYMSVCPSMTGGHYMHVMQCCWYTHRELWNSPKAFKTPGLLMMIVPASAYENFLFVLSLNSLSLSPFTSPPWQNCRYRQDSVGNVFMYSSYAHTSIQ